MKCKLLLLCILIVVGLAAAWRPAVGEELTTFKIVPSMMNHLRAMERTVIVAKPRSVSEHKNIAISLNKDLERLIESCRMKGEAHDALHQWIGPFAEELQRYTECQDLKLLSESLGRIRQSFTMFNTRFE